MSKRFLCYNTEDAKVGKVNVNQHGCLEPIFYEEESKAYFVKKLLCNAKEPSDRGYYTTAITDEAFMNGLVAGETYCVSIDGVEYEDVAKLNNPTTTLGNYYLSNGMASDNGLPFYITAYPNPATVDGVATYGNIITKTNNVTVSVYQKTTTVHTFDEKFVPELSHIVLKSSTANSTKKFKVVVDDSGKLSATEI